MNALNQKAEEKAVTAAPAGNVTIIEDEFLSMGDVGAISRELIAKTAKAVLVEIEGMFRDKKWDDAITLYHPVEEKMPELSGSGMADAVREKMAFALGQVKRFDEAISVLEICLVSDPDNFYIHNSLAYTAYNSLYAAKNREIFLSGKPRKDRIDLAHRHFKAAQALRTGHVTNFYREAMLFRQIEDKGTPALPLFLTAIANWERLTTEEKTARHQERKNYIKSLYQGASLVLENGGAKKAMALIERCLGEDTESNYITLTFKYFALGKIHFQWGKFQEARDALLFALKCRISGPVDFVRELLARTYLAVEKPLLGLQEIEKIPENSRRPYVCWTESDLRARLGELDRAKTVLVHSAKNDQRSRHKTLVRLARLDYLLGNYRETMAWGKKASAFYEEKWGKDFADGLYWQAVGAIRCGLKEDARALSGRIEEACPEYPDLKKLKPHLA